MTCNIGSLNVGGSATVTITAAVSPSLRGSLDNTATVSVTQSNSNAFNNSSTASTTVVGMADLSVVKSDSPDP